jgi:hypothetical protein
MEQKGLARGEGEWRNKRLQRNCVPSQMFPAFSYVRGEMIRLLKNWGFLVFWGVALWFKLRASQPEK